jgi:hypothetical protein
VSDVTPVIPGYQFDQRLLEHPLAELWHGRTFTGMEIVALVLSEAGARDETVRDRLVRAGRDAAFESDQLETPLWAANFSTDRPYAITQLIPGQSGAERLIDPLDGVIGNDDESLQAVRTRLSQYGAMAPSLTLSGAEADAIPTYADRPQSQPSPQAQPGLRGQPSPQAQPGLQSQPSPQDEPSPQAGQAAGQPAQTQGQGEWSALGVAREYRRKIGGWAYLIAAVIVLIVFTVTYSVGAAIGSAVKKDPNEAAAPQPAVSPGAYPSPVLLPAIKKVTTTPYKRPDGSPGVFGATYPARTDLQVITNAALPFAFGWPRPPEVTSQGESSQVVYRKVQTKLEPGRISQPSLLTARIALHPCASLAGCLTDRAAFDRQWAKAFKAQAPTAAKDSRTWLTVQGKNPYVVTMTRAYQSGGQWWLVGAAVTGAPGEESAVQSIVNDIRRQLS